MTVTMRLDPAAIQYGTVVRPEVCTDGSLAYVAEIPDLPGCMSHGSTVEEARQNLEDAKREYLAALGERGLPIPTPSIDPIVTTVQWTLIGTTQPRREETTIKAPTATIESLNPYGVAAPA